MTDLDQIRERINIVDFISESVPLKKMGRNFKGLCPFHTERTPSFVVSPDRQIWHCFGCGKGGDIFTFLMELDGIDFPEALKILAEKSGVKLEARAMQGKESELKERLLRLHELTAEYYHYVLCSHSLGARARQYLKERGVKDQTIKSFMLGFAPTSWDNVAKFLNKKGFSAFEIEQSGLGIKGRNGVYDRFRGRVMFPIRNYRGQCIAFAGRVLDKEAKDLPAGRQEPKYINSPETPLYTKGETLFGLHLTKESIRKENTAVIVEGEFDVISSFQSGLSYVVAIKGSALTEAQVRLLKRFCEKIVLALDSDMAGNEAARRGIEIADSVGLDVRVARVPFGKDPDEAARENAHAWKQSVDTAVPVYDFLIESAFSRHDGNEAFGKKKITDELLPIFLKIENGIVQAHFFKKLAKRLEMSEEKLVEIAKKSRRVPINAQQSRPEPAVEKLKKTVEDHLLSALIQSENVDRVVETIKTKVDESMFVDEVLRKIYMQLIAYCESTQNATIGEFARILPSELVTRFDQLYLAEVDKVADEELQTIVYTLIKTSLRRKIKELTTNIASAERTEDKEYLTRLTDELAQTTSTLKQLQTDTAPASKP